MKKIMLVFLFSVFNLNLSCSVLQSYVPYPVVSAQISEVSGARLKYEKEKCERADRYLSKFCNPNIVGMIVFPAVLYGISQSNVGVVVGALTSFFAVNFLVDIEKRDNLFIKNMIERELNNPNREKHTP